MREDNKVQICEVLDELGNRDPEWKTGRMAPKFKTLYDGWRAAELRKRKHSTLFYTDSWNRGWLPIADFRRFRRYALQ